MSRNFVLLTISVSFFFAAPSVIGEDSSPQRKTTAQVDQRLLNDLSRIRKQMGGSVLSGSSLDRPSEHLLPSTDELIPADKFAGLVKTLRDHSSTLDRIANEIEPTKQYGNADQLRNTANELRKLARQFDTDAGQEIPADADDTFQSDLKQLLKNDVESVLPQVPQAAKPNTQPSGL